MIYSEQSVNIRSGTSQVHMLIPRQERNWDIFFWKFSARPIQVNGHAKLCYNTLCTRVYLYLFFLITGANEIILTIHWAILSRFEICFFAK